MSGGEFAPELAAEEIRVAVREGIPGRVSSLLSTWPELLEVRDGDGMTPLFLAAAFGQAEIVRLLLDGGADMHAANRFGAMPFHQAAYAGHRRIVEMLLERGEKVDVKDGDDRTALHLTAWKNRQEIALLLIEKGARVDTGDSAGRGATPLHYAAALGSADVARTLLEHCANIDAMAMEGATPLHMAVSRKKPKLVQLLITYDAEVTRKDANGRTAIDLASLSGDRDLEGLLLGRGEATADKIERQTRRKCPSRR
jgi:ankyrin repeat protein